MKKHLLHQFVSVFGIAFLGLILFCLIFRFSSILFAWAVLTVCISTAIISYKHVALGQILHLPTRYSRRAGAFRVCISGWTSLYTHKLEFRLNRGPWLNFKRLGERCPWPMFTIEFDHDQLCAGKNELEIRFHAPLRKSYSIKREFEYDSSPTKLPIEIDWKETELDVGDGHWEAFEQNGQWRVRPVDGYGKYDRILVFSGAFLEGRRIETDVTFRKRHKRWVKFRWKKDRFGFGVLPLWGGHPEEKGIQPARGWCFSLGWYWSPYYGVGQEYSLKEGGGPPVFICMYQNFTMKSDICYSIILEVWSQRDAQGKHISYKQRMKWWPKHQPEPTHWWTLEDTQGCPIPEREYGAAFVCYYSICDFGPVKILPLESKVFK